MKQLIEEINSAFDRKLTRAVLRRLLIRAALGTCLILAIGILHVLASFNHWETVLIGTNTAHVLISACLTIICYQRYVKMRRHKDLYTIRQYRRVANLLLCLSVVGVFVTALNLFGIEAILG